MKMAAYHNLPTGGALRALQELMARLSGHHHIDGYTLSSSAQNGHALDDCGVEPVVFDYFLGNPAEINIIQWIKAFKRMILIQQQIARWINLGDYDICLTNACPYFEIPSLHRFIETPCIYYAHSVPNPAVRAIRSHHIRKSISLNPIAWSYKRAVRKEKQRAIRCADYVVTNSLFLKTELKKRYGVDAIVNHLGVDAAIFYPEPDAAKGSYVLGVGTLAPFKAHDFSIQSISLIPEKHRPELWIAYPSESPGERDYLIKLAEQKNVRLRLFEKVGSDGMRMLYSSAMATVYPSSYEALGLVPLESMACGTPAVGVAEGGITETIKDNVTGYLTRRDPKEFAEKITEIITRPELASKLGAAGREYIIANWNWDRSTDQLEKLLINAASHKNRPAHQSIQKNYYKCNSS